MGSVSNEKGRIKEEEEGGRRDEVMTVRSKRSWMGRYDLTLYSGMGLPILSVAL